MSKVRTYQGSAPMALVQSGVLKRVSAQNEDLYGDLILNVIFMTVWILVIKEQNLNMIDLWVKASKLPLDLGGEL